MSTHILLVQTRFRSFYHLVAVSLHSKSQVSNHYSFFRFSDRQRCFGLFTETFVRLSFVISNYRRVGYQPYAVDVELQRRES